jgi:hypothetical protein
MIKKNLFYLTLASTIIGCNTPPANENPTQPTTIDYVTVGSMMDTVRLPYVIDLASGKKRLVFIGCDHNTDTSHAQYRTIEQYFNDLKPQIAFNEGGQIPETVHFGSGREAITKSGETGYLKYLCDNAGIRMMDGDINDSLEFSITLHKHDRDQLLLYYLMERLVIPYLYGAYGQKPFEELYQEAIEHWFIDRGFPVAGELRSFSGFQQLYRTHVGNEFELKITMDIEKFDYINGGDCRFCAIGRTSKMVRDSILLQKIDKSLKEYDRVMITFGGGHALAVEPALKEMMERGTQ